MIQSSDNTQNLNFDLTQKAFPIKLLLKDEKDMFAASKKSIDATDGYSVKIDGQYLVDGNSVKVQHEQQIK